MEYQVPQFIEVEDKIIGPLTLKQFIYVAGASGLCVIFFFYLPLVVALLFSAPTIGFAAALAFYKVNGKPFIAMLEAGFNYYKGAKLFLWRHEVPPAGGGSASGGNASAAAATAAADAAARTARATPRLTRGRLAELAWSLDIQAPDPSLGLRSEQK